MADCAESECERQATVRLRIPWTDNRTVCAAHARVQAQRDGIVAEPLPEFGEE